MLFVYFAREVRQRRDAFGWSQGHLAEVAHLHLNTVGNVENLRRKPGIPVIFALALALETTPGELLGPAWDEYSKP